MTQLISPTLLGRPRSNYPNSVAAPEPQSSLSNRSYRGFATNSTGAIHMRHYSSSAQSRVAGRARLRTLTAVACAASVAGVAGLAVALHSDASATDAKTDTTTTDSTSNSHSDQIQPPDSDPESTQQAPLATTNGS